MQSEEDGSVRMKEDIVVITEKRGKVLKTVEKSEPYPQGGWESSVGGGEVE